jgi:hypothetical protein
VHERHQRIAVQPIEGPQGPALRASVAQLLRRRGFRVVTSLAPVTGTAQYPGLARDHGIAAFVVADVQPGSRSQAVTFLVWHGSNGSVARRWSVAAPASRLPQAVGRGFWPHLGRALAAARTPSSGNLPPARPMRIDASDPHDEAIVSAVR